MQILRTETYYRICFNINTRDAFDVPFGVRYTDLAQAEREVVLFRRLAKERCRPRKVSIWNWALESTAHLRGEEAVAMRENLEVEYSSWLRRIADYIGNDNNLSYGQEDLVIERVQIIVEPLV